ncbi:MAG: flagellar brake protein [Sterolibacterium sp.]|jgi:c-di-GMP-binding flagellar brake protein YcgR|nr:flagellar brake protein [Sterolibacterium sp.]
MTDQLITSLPVAAHAQSRLEPVPADDGKDYTLRARPDILGVLRSLLDRNVLMTAYFNQGNDFLMTALLKIAADGYTLILDVGNDKEMNQRALAAGRLICVALLDKIKIQFVLDGVKPVQFEARPAFMANTPQALLRLQRREFYRFVMPVLHPLKCTVPLKTYDGSQLSVDVNVIDISGGGVGVVAKTEEFTFSSDMLLENCRIDLPGVGVLTTHLRVRSIGEITLRTGARHKRAGCQFIDLSGQQQMLLQRFIIKAERERKARESGLG